tara:strand:- start:195 stop:431 length:237 start_codon:yes stop_codon:yes gene_type:complete
MAATEWTEVESSNIDRVGWTSPNALYIKFNNGSIYEYKSDDNLLIHNYYTKLLAAESVGGYFNSVIRKDKDLKVLKIW